MDIKEGDKVKLAKKASNFVREFKKGHEFTVLRVREDLNQIDLEDADGERILGCPLDSLTE